MRRLSAALLLIAFLSAFAIAESPNPFTSSGGPTGLSTMPVSRGIVALAPYLRTMTDRLAELARTIHDSRSPGPLLALALVSLLYGIFHALGPGHGKTVVSTYFLARDAKVSHSLVAGYLIALVHAISAIGMVIGIYYIVRGIFSSTFENASAIVQAVSFGVITLLGAWMLFNRIRGKEHHHGSLENLGHSHGHGHERAHAHGHDHGPGQVHEDGLGHDHGPDRSADEGGLVPSKGIAAVKTRELLGIAVAAGLVPCPGASAIILVCLSLGLVVAGVLSVVMISVGMGLTVSAIAAIAILAKRGVVKVSSSGRGELSGPVRKFLEIAGAALLFLFGLVFLIVQLSGFGPL